MGGPVSGSLSGSLAFLPSTTPAAMAAWVATFAGLYSFQERLVSSYSGPLFKVRDATSGTETDIGYIPATHQIDTTALAAACPAHNGFVVTWYDQSGNGRNLTQATSPAVLPSTWMSPVTVGQGV